MMGAHAGSELRRRGTRVRRRSVMLWRGLIAVVLASAGTVLVVFERSFRVGEVAVAAVINRWILGDIVTTGTTDGQPAVTFGNARVGYSIVVTVECSVAFYIALLFALGAALALIPRVAVTRVLLSVVAAGAGMALLNQVRFFLLEFTLLRAGVTVFEWMHSLVGSTLMLLGVCACLFLLFRVAISETKFGRVHRGLERAHRGNGVK